MRQAIYFSTADEKPAMFTRVLSLKALFEEGGPRQSDETITLGSQSHP